MNDIEWKSFILTDIFDIASTNSGIDKNKIKNGSIEGKNPYITRTDKNNGIDEFIVEQDYKLNNGNVITIGLDTQTVFYQPHAFYTGQNVQILSNDHLNKYNGLYLVNLLKIVLEKFNWGGNGATLTRLKNSRILIPINDEGLPNYNYMESITKKTITAKIEKYEKYIAHRKSQLNYKQIETLANKEWGEFYIKDLFNVLSGKRLTKDNMIEGKIPFIGATSFNNGITNYVSNKNESLDCNVLGVNYNGSVVENFYHPYPCIFSDDVKRFHLKEYEDNKHVLLFFKSIILQQKVKYMYGYKFNSKRMNEQVILVPINELNKPDYEYMEQYMINTEINKLNAYEKYINNMKSIT